MLPISNTKKHTDFHIMSLLNIGRCQALEARAMELSISDKYFA